MVELTKKCTKCGRILPLEMFCKRNDKPCGYASHCKDCNAKRYKEWVEKNKEKRKEYNKLRRQKIKDKINEYKRKRYHENREKILEREKIRRATTNGRATHMANNYKWEDIKRGRTNNISSKHVLQIALSNPCFYCGETDWHKLGLDRIDNSIGHVIGNVVPCCRHCNAIKHTKSFEDFCEEMNVNPNDADRYKQLKSEDFD